MKQKILSLALLLAIVAVPAVSSAATYWYVNTSGNIGVVNADNASQALTLPIDIAAHSGVLLVAGTPVMTETTMTGTSGSDMNQNTNASSSINTSASSTTTEASSTTM